jgi:hypothetical protein
VLTANNSPRSIQLRTFDASTPICFAKAGGLNQWVEFTELLRCGLARIAQRDGDAAHIRFRKDADISRRSRRLDLPRPNDILDSVKRDSQPACDHAYGIHLLNVILHAGPRGFLGIGVVYSAHTIVQWKKCWADCFL